MTIASQPAGQICSVISGSGIVADGPVTSVSVACEAIPAKFTIGGSVLGIFPRGSGLMLQVNGGGHLTINENGTFRFLTQFASGSDYLITIAQQPVGQLCFVRNGQGTVGNKDVTDVNVICSSMN